MLDKFLLQIVIFALLTMTFGSSAALALEGGPLQLNLHNGWSAFQVIAVDEDPTGDDLSWSMPATFDGMGAFLADDATLRIQINHEISDATISEVNLDLPSFRTAITNTVSSGVPGIRFVTSARQAYDRWSPDGGATWTLTSDRSNTAFQRFCSGQSYLPNTFGAGRGFVDNVYITGEESFGNASFDRLFALDLDNRDFYQLSGVSGAATGGIGGMPFDS